MAQEDYDQGYADGRASRQSEIEGSNGVEFNRGEALAKEIVRRCNLGAAEVR